MKYIFPRVKITKLVTGNYNPQFTLYGFKKKILGTAFISANHTEKEHILHRRGKFLDRIKSLLLETHND